MYAANNLDVVRISNNIDNYYSRPRRILYLPYDEPDDSQNVARNKKCAVLYTDDTLSEPSKELFVVSSADFINAFSFTQEGRAHLLPISVIDCPEASKLRDKRAYMGDNTQWKTAFTYSDPVKDIVDYNDYMPLYLDFLFYLFLQGSSQGVAPSEVSFFVPDFFKFTGNYHPSYKNFDLLISRISSFGNLFGVIESSNPQFPSAIYRVLTGFYYNVATNIISVSSPYITAIIEAGFQEKLTYYQTAKQQVPDDILDVRVTRTSLSPSLFLERNHAAVENVRILTQLFDRAGKYHMPNIMLKTLIERNIYLSSRLSQAKSKDVASKILRLTFQKTWELLNTATNIERTHPDIHLPSPDSNMYKPSMKDVASLKLVF